MKNSSKSDEFPVRVGALVDPAPGMSLIAVMGVVDNIGTETVVETDGRVVMGTGGTDGRGTERDGGGEC